jgi:phospholipase/carboxylesterase
VSVNARDDEAPVEVETGPDPVAAVIWLHGLGADGHDFEPVVPELRLPDSPAVRFVFPHAPVRPVTVNGGYRMRAWYDLAVTAQGFWQCEEHLQESRQLVDQLIRRENNRGIPCARLVLAGFSQGGAVALYAGLRHPARLAGIMALSAPAVDGYPGGIEPDPDGAPLFVAHGTDDTVVPFSHARRNCAWLAALGRRVTWREYRMGHGVIPAELADIGDWLTGILGL